MKKKDFILIAVVLIAVVALFGYTKLKDANEKAAFVEVYKDNELYKEIPLDEEAEFTIKDGEHINKVKVHDRGVEVTEANCPDKVCVKTGFITKPSQSIVCIPNKLNIKIVDSNSDDSIDAVVQ